MYFNLVVMKKYYLKFKKLIKKSRMNLLEKQLNFFLFVKKNNVFVKLQRITKIEFENLDEFDEKIYESSIQYQKQFFDNFLDL